MEEREKTKKGKTTRKEGREGGRGIKDLPFNAFSSSMITDVAESEPASTASGAACPGSCGASAWKARSIGGGKGKEK